MRIEPPPRRDAMQRARAIKSWKKHSGTHLVEGHLLRYASGLAAASGASLPHRFDRRISSREAAGPVVPTAAAVIAIVVVVVLVTAAVTVVVVVAAADLAGCPEGMAVLLQG